MVSRDSSLSDRNSLSLKALNAIFETRHNPKKAKTFSNDWHEIGPNEIERIKQIRMTDIPINDVSSRKDDEYNNKISKLKKQIEQVRHELQNIKYKNEGNAENRLLMKNDFLTIHVRDCQSKIEAIETKFDILKKAHKNVVDALSQVHLKNEFQDEIDEMREDLKNTIADGFEARTLLKELQKIAWTMLPSKIAHACENVENQMEKLKLKYEEIQYVIYKKKLELSRSHKEIFALASALNGEARIINLYEQKCKTSEIVADQLKEKYKALCVVLAREQRQFSMDEKAISAIEKKPRGRPPSAPIPTIEIHETSEAPRISLVIPEEKLEFLKDKIKEVNKEILTAKEEIVVQKKNCALLKEETLDTVNLRAEVKRSWQERKLMATRLQQEIILRKTYYNQIEDLKGKIRVFCRCRPITQDETNRGSKQCVEFPDIFTVVVAGISRDKKGKEFQFDRVFTTNSLQEDIFKDASRLLQSAFDGFNVCIFAYGQTGSGKTFTLIGNLDSNPGIAPRTFDKIFEIANEGNVKFKTYLQCYMLELYNEKLLDLLASGAVYSDKLEIKKDPHGMVYVPGAELIGASDAAHLKALFMKGNSNRHIASTKMNSESSRSHLIISVMITCQWRNSDQVMRGKISIIDLAGSERMNKSGVQGVGAQEAMCINMSLSALGDVISALTTGQAFIPYRNNKLTLLMQDSIGGNAKTLMFVNISPVDYNGVETVSSLTYGARVKLIKNESSRSADADEIPKLKKIIESLMRGENINF